MLYILSFTNLNGKMRFRNDFPHFFSSSTRFFNAKLFYVRGCFVKICNGKWKKKKTFCAYFNNSVIEGGSEQVLA